MREGIYQDRIRTNEEALDKLSRVRQELVAKELTDIQLQWWHEPDGTITIQVTDWTFAEILS